VNRTAEFIQDVVCKFGKLGMLRIFCLRFERRIAAVIFGFEYASTMFGYLSAFDPQYEELGLGRLLMYHSLRYSFERGYTRWDFLRGDEPYKQWWGAQRVPKCRVIVSRRP
jgi:CelD/BcsL family acetyltransferase involved in cellulose biosynthesis